MGGKEFEGLGKKEWVVQKAGHRLVFSWIEGASQSTLPSIQSIVTCAIARDREIGKSYAATHTVLTLHLLHDTPYLAIQSLPLASRLLAGKGSMQG